MSTDSSAFKVLQDIGREMGELDEFVKLCQSALRYTFNVQYTSGVLGRTLYEGTADPTKADDAKKWRETMEQLGKVTKQARHHIDDRFSYLYGLAVVRLWAAVEAGLNDLCLALMEAQGEWKKSQRLKSIKVSASEFFDATPVDRLYIALHALEAAVGSGGPGIGKYESMLKELGLGGDVPENARKVLIRLAETRHLLVHKRGKADKEFLDKCPWLGMAVDETVKVGPEEFLMSMWAVWTYVMTLADRLALIGLADVEPGRKAIADDFEGGLAQFNETGRPPKGYGTLMTGASDGTS